MNKMMRQQNQRRGRRFFRLLSALALCGLTGCAGHQQASDGARESPLAKAEERIVAPLIVTDKVPHDSDDPAIWVHPTDPSKSLIIATDKNQDGGLFVFGLDGPLIPEKTAKGLQRPNNVDVAYGLRLKGQPVDIAVTTERLTHKLRVYRLPEMTEIAPGGLAVFAGETARDPMGIALYQRPADGAVFAIVSRKSGPTSGYLWQYRLADDGKGNVKATKVRAFGQWSGQKEIESVAVDNPLGYVYYSDEGVGIRKYHADPDAPNAPVELALFGTEGFADDREGISLYQVQGGTGYILVSDQQANQFHVFKREGEPGHPHLHQRVKVVTVKANQSDGSELTSRTLSDKFIGGLFVAMSDDATFHFYAWKDIAGSELMISHNGAPPGS